MKQITFKLDLHEVNLIIKALSERPFREVYALVGKIHAQSSAQISTKDPQATKDNPRPEAQD